MPKTYWDTAKITDRLDVAFEDADAPVVLTPGVDESTTSAGGRTAGAIDDFEDNDISEYANNTASFTTQTSTVFEGTYALEGTNPDNSTPKTIGSTSGLPSYPQAGDSFRWREYKTSADDFSGFLFAVQDATNPTNDCYYIRAETSQNTFEIFRYIGGSASQIASTSVSPPTNEWLEIQVDWEETGLITATLFDAASNQLAQISATDSEYSGGGVGFRQFVAESNGGSSYLDIAEITETTTSTGAIDDFEDGDLSEYTTILSGTGSSASTQTNAVFEGTYGLEITADNDGGLHQIQSDTGLPIYPMAGDTFDVRMQLTNNAIAVCRFGFDELSNNSNGYRLEIREDNTNGSAFRLSKYDGGSFVTLAKNDSLSLSTGVWYRIETEWGDDGNIVCRIYDDTDTLLDTISATDETTKSGQFGFEGGELGSGVNAKNYFDIAQVTTTTTGASTTGVVDDFEDNDIAEYGGDTGNYTTGTSIVNSGTYSLTCDVPNGATDIASTAGLNLYPEAGDTIEYHVQFNEDPDNSALIYLGFASQSETAFPDGYDVVLDGNNTTFRVFDRPNFNTIAQDSNVTYDANVWYRVEVDWSSQGGITARLINTSTSTQVSEISGTDTTYSSGGIHLGAQIDSGYDGTEEMYFDDINLI